jgi:murein DD-endopeptidase MepM/ murein hydrolase activator NlpD
MHIFLSRMRKNSIVMAVFLLLVALVGLPVGSQAVRAEDWETTYDVKMTELKGKVEGLNTQIGSLNQNIGEVEERQSTLAQEISAIRQEITKSDDIIKDTKAAISLTETQISDVQASIDKTNEKIGGIFREIQQSQVSSLVEVVFSSQTLDQALGKVSALNSIENRLGELKTEAKVKKAELEDSKLILAQAQKAQEQTQAYNQSRKDQLDYLIQETRNEEARYQKILSDVKEQQNSFAADLSQLDADKKAEAERRAAEEKKRREEYARQQAELSRRNNLGNLQANGGTGSTATYNYNYLSGSRHGGGDDNSCGIINETVNFAGIPTGVWQNPTNGVVTNGFGCVPGAGIGGDAHDAADIANGSGTEIYAAADGVVVRAGWAGGYGNSLVVKHTFGARRIYSTYGHMQVPPVVVVGQSVSKGELVGYMGTTGNSTGVHLHFSLADESWEYTRNSNCNPNYGASVTSCFNPFTGPFQFYNK